jgi:hypothetical protein
MTGGMMVDNVIRWSGLLLIAGSALLGFAIVSISIQPVVNQQFTPGISRVVLLSSILLLLSFPGMYMKQANSAGWLGLAGFALLQTGMLLLVVMASTPLLYPSIKVPSGENIVVFLLGIALIFGLFLTGIATIQARVFPLWSGILLLLATAAIFFTFLIAEFLPPMTGQIGSAFFGIVLAIALIWIGLSIWTGSFS